VLVQGEAGLAPLLLLHGTGGNEHDLLSLGRHVAPRRTLLSPRGRVLENGMPRFFRRFAEGRFDEASVLTEANALAVFVEGIGSDQSLGRPIALGFSNGANIAAALLQLHPRLLAGAVLIRAMVPLAEPPKADLAGLPVLLLTGAHDPIVPAANAAELERRLTSVNARVDHRVLAAGHGLTDEDVQAAAHFLQTLG